MRWILLTFAACLLVCTLRNALAVGAPLLIWDDVILFNEFFAGRGSLLHVYPDSVSLAPNAMFLVGFKLFGLTHLPAALQTMAIVFYAAMTATPSLPPFGVVMPDPRKRMLLAVWLAAMPLSDLALILSPDYQNWSAMIPVFLFTGLLAAATVIERPHVSPWWSALIIPCALANPLSAATAPFNAAAAAILWRKRSTGTALTAAGLAGAGAAAALLVAVTAPARPDHAAEAAGILGAAWRGGLFLLDRGLLEALVGSPARQAAIDALPAAGPGLAPAPLYAVAAGLGTALGAFAGRRARRRVLVFAAAMAGAAYAYSALVLIALGAVRGVDSADAGILTTFGRYWFVQKVAVLAGLGALVLERPRLLPARLRSSAAMLALGAFLLAYAANADVGSRYGLSGRVDPRRAERQKRSAAQHAFLQSVRAAARDGKAACLVEPGDPGAPLLRLRLPQGSGPPGTADGPCSSP